MDNRKDEIIADRMSHAIVFYRDEILQIIIDNRLFERLMYMASDKAVNELIEKIYINTKKKIIEQEKITFDDVDEENHMSALWGLVVELFQDIVNTLKPLFDLSRQQSRADDYIYYLDYYQE